jgi:hypothetical protein
LPAALQTASELEGRITDAEAQLITLKRLRWGKHLVSAPCSTQAERSRRQHTCAAVRCRQTAVQQVKEQQEAIEAARTSVQGFKRDVEQMKSAMQVCLWSVALLAHVPGRWHCR